MLLGSGNFWSWQQKRWWGHWNSLVSTFIFFPIVKKCDLEWIKVFLFCFVFTVPNASYSPPCFAAMGCRAVLLPLRDVGCPWDFGRLHLGWTIYVIYVIVSMLSSRMAIKAFNCTWKLNQVTTWLPCTKSLFYSTSPVQIKYLQGTYKVTKNKSMILAGKGLKFLSSILSACLESAGDLLQSNRICICSRYPTLSPVNAWAWCWYSHPYFVISAQLLLFTFMW